MKTLKDIYDYSKMSYISDEADEVVNDLKDAAREWLKEAEYADLPGVSWDDTDRALAFNEGAEWFIIKFFNLEDEE